MVAVSLHGYQAMGMWLVREKTILLNLKYIVDVEDSIHRKVKYLNFCVVEVANFGVM